MNRILFLVAVFTVGIQPAVAVDWETCLQRLSVLTGHAALPAELGAGFIRDRSISPRPNQRAETVAYLKHLAENLNLPAKVDTWSQKYRVPVQPNTHPTVWERLFPKYTGEFEIETRFFRNLTVDVAGTDPALQHQKIVVGAHYDVQNSLSGAWKPKPSLHFEATPGADDNGSGVVAVTALMERLAKNPLPRPVQFVFFDAEEPGKFNEFLVGSYHYVNQLSPRQRENIHLAIILDMVGAIPQSPTRAMNFSYTENALDRLPIPLQAGGARQAFPLSFLVKSDVEKHYLGDLADSRPFQAAEIPVALVTNVTTIKYLPRHYHTMQDDLPIINGPHMMKVIDFVEAWLRGL